MKFSVIIPVYNVEPYLKDCLDSVLNQTFSDWEALCVDDGSTDGSLSILNEYAGSDSRFRVVHKENGGLSSARNAGMNAAEGEYLLFLDSDDWIASDTLETISRNLDGEDLLCFSGVKFYETTGNYSPREQLKSARHISGLEYFNSYSLEPKELHFDCAVSRAYRRQYLQDCGLRFKEGIFHEDYLFTPQACYYAKDVSVLDECLYLYRIRSGSITGTVTLKNLLDYIDSTNELVAFFKEKDIDKSVIYRRLAQSYQVFILRSSPAADSAVRQHISWPSYRLVSRDRVRHRLNFIMAKISFRLLRCLFTI